MKVLVVLSLVIATALAHPGGYGEVRKEIPLPPVIRSSSTEAPLAYAPAPAPVKSYGAYEAKVELKHGLETATPTPIPIVRHSHVSDHAGKYQLDVETGHGIVQSENGQLKELNLSEGPVGVKTGSYSYTGPDGKQYTVNWVADEHGFRATGDHLPTPPPVPEAIQKSLALPRLPEHLLAGPSGEEELPTSKAPAAYGGYSTPAVRAPPPPARVTLGLGHAPALERAPPPPAAVQPLRTPY